MISTAPGFESPLREGEADEAIQLVAVWPLDCFAEPVIGPRLARTRWLAMTEETS
jgi:hypothetical protein